MSRQAETEGYITLTSSSEDDSGTPSPPSAKRNRAAAAAATAAAAPSRRQPPRRGLAGGSQEASPAPGPAHGPAASVGLRRNSRRAAGLEHRGGQAAALAHLRQARAAAAAHRGDGRHSRRTAAVIDDDSDDEGQEEQGQGGKGQGDDGGSSDGQPPAGRSPAVRRQGRRGGRARNKFLTGAQDYVQSESDDGASACWPACVHQVALPRASSLPGPLQPVRSSPALLLRDPLASSLAVPSHHGLPVLSDPPIPVCRSWRLHCCRW